MAILQPDQSGLVIEIEVLVRSKELCQVGHLERDRRVSQATRRQEG